MEIVKDNVLSCTHLKVLNDILSVVTNVLSVCRLWPQLRPCHSTTTGLSSLSDRLLGAVAAPPRHWEAEGVQERILPAITPATSDELSLGQAWHLPSPTLYLHPNSGRFLSLCLSSLFTMIFSLFGFCDSFSSPLQSSCHQVSRSTCSSTCCTRLSPHTAASRSSAQRYQWFRFQNGKKSNETGWERPSLDTNLWGTQ